MSRSECPGRALTVAKFGLALLLAVAAPAGMGRLLAGDEPSPRFGPGEGTEISGPAGAAADWKERPGRLESRCAGCVGSVARGAVTASSAHGSLTFELTGMSWGGAEAAFAAADTTFSGRCARTPRSADVEERVIACDGGFEVFVEAAARGGAGDWVLKGLLRTALTIECPPHHNSPTFRRGNDVRKPWCRFPRGESKSAQMSRSHIGSC